MTLVVALFNGDEIVIASDTMIYDASYHKLVKPFHKVRTLGPHVFACAGTTTPFDIGPHWCLHLLGPSTSHLLRFTRSGCSAQDDI